MGEIESREITGRVISESRILEDSLFLFNMLNDEIPKLSGYSNAIQQFFFVSKWNEIALNIKS